MPVRLIWNDGGGRGNEDYKPVPTTDAEYHLGTVSTVIGTWITWFCGPCGRSQQKGCKPFYCIWLPYSAYLLQTTVLWQIAYRWRGRSIYQFLSYDLQFPCLKPWNNSVLSSRIFPLSLCETAEYFRPSQVYLSNTNTTQQVQNHAAIQCIFMKFLQISSLSTGRKQHETFPSSWNRVRWIYK